MGLVILGAMLLYLLIAIAVVKLAIAHARKNDKNSLRWGLGAALVMYLIPFWDWIPTVVAHKYYCATEAGFTVYKTLDEWKKENPGVMETLVDGNSSPEGVSPNWPTVEWSGKKISSINQRFGIVYKNHLIIPEENKILLNVWRWQYELVDKKTGEVLAKRVDFSTGNGYIGGEPPIKFWLQNEHCIEGKEQSNKFSYFLKPFKGVIK